MTPELAIVGAGYVGLPLARCFAEAGVGVVLVDVDEDHVAEFIELAGKVNENRPYFWLENIARALNSQEKAVKGSRVHIVRVSYKADVGDLRESPALKLIELLRDEGAELSYHDPHVPELPITASPRRSSTARWRMPIASPS
jgi:UDP-N-acetyl-D-mannosaminuronate dehydrogenase